MERPFKGRSHGIDVSLQPGERDLLVHLLGQLDQLLDDGGTASTDPLAAMVGFDLVLPPEDGGRQQPAGPQDPALARLLPDGSRDDPEAAAEFRRFTESGLRSRKRDNARRAAAALGGTDAPAPARGVVLAGDEAQALLTALTDLRLVLAERLELRSDEDADRLHRVLREQAAAARAGDPPDPWAASAAIYDILTFWQESLVAALTSRAQRRRRSP